MRPSSRMLSLLSLAALGCGTDDETGLPVAGGIDVQATVSGASLASNCPDVATTAGAAFAPSGVSADRAAPCQQGTACPSFCQQSAVQISLSASLGVGAGVSPGSAVIRIVRVRVVDARTGQALDELTSRDPRVWQQSAYVPWDERVVAGANLRTSYKVSAPDWSKMAGAMRFRVEVTLSVDGASRTIQSAEISREPILVT